MGNWDLMLHIVTKEVEELHMIVKDIQKNFADIIINYLKCLEQASALGINTFIDDRLQANLKITSQDCINSMLTVINRELNDT